MFLTVMVPVQLLQAFVTLELADETVAVERDEHPPAHLPPPLDLLIGEVDPGAQRLLTTFGEEIQHL